MSRCKNNLYLLGGFALIAASRGVFKLYQNYYKSDNLNSWLEEYIKEVEEKLQSLKNNDQPLNVETICHVINLVAEIEEYLYMKENSHLENTRISLMKTDGYENAVMECIAAHEKTFQRANKIIEKKLKLNINELQANLEELSGQSSSDKQSVKELLKICKKNYPLNILPKITKEKLKEAYLYYTKQIEILHKVDLNNLNITKIKPEFKEVALHVYLVNKYILRDTLKEEFGIEEKILNQLLIIHELDKDPQIVEQKQKISHI
jgi:hypothetical protein